jgi:CHAT domain-containing protein
MQLHASSSNQNFDSFVLTLQNWLASEKRLCVRSRTSRTGSLVVFVAIIFSPCYAQNDAASLQRRSIQSIDSFLENFRKTGDRQSLRPQLEQAEKDLLISAQTFSDNGDFANASVSLHKLGAAQRLQERWEPALASFKLAHTAAVKARNTENQAKALNGMAMVEYMGLRDFDAAATHLEESIRLSSSGADKKILFDALNLKAELQEARGDLIAAAATINLAYEVALGLNDDLSLYFAVNERASIYLSLVSKCDAGTAYEDCVEKFNRTKSDYEQALSITRKLGYNFLASLKNNSLTQLENRRRMLQMDKQISEGFTGSRIFKLNAPYKVAMNEVFLSRGQDIPPEDKRVLQEGLQELIRQNGLGDATGQFVEGQGRLMLGQDEAASIAFRKAVALLDSDRRSLRDGMVRGSFLENKMEIYYYAMLDFLDQRKYAEAFDVLERSKSRAMADVLRSQELKFTNPAERRFYADSISIDANISSLQKDVFKARTTGQSAKPIADIEREIQKLEADRQNLVKAMSAQGLKLQELLAPRTATLAELQLAMKQDRFEVLSYVVTKSNVILWHIKDDGVNVRSIFLPRPELIRKVRSLRESLTDRDHDQNREFDQQTARELFLFLIQPALQWIKTNHLVIIPHDDLNYIPFQVFQDPTNNQFLGERFQLSYAPNATTLLQLKKIENIRGGNLLATADPEFEDEVEVIGNVHSGRNKIVSSPLIDEASLKAQIGDYSLIHLSVHGKFNTDAPLLSHLKLRKHGTDDGMLTAAEMFGLSLAPNSLVVLSACETGRAEATQANEIVGIARALLYAGANNLILSSWRVDEASTAVWMETFYKEAESKPLSEAARQASLAVKKNPKYNHPYYWSPFLLIGK